MFRKKSVISVACMLLSALSVWGQRNDTPQIISDSRAALKRADYYCGDSISKKVGDMRVLINWIKESEWITYQHDSTYFMINAVNRKQIRLFSYSEYFNRIKPLLKKDSKSTDPRFYIERFKPKNTHILECRAEGLDLYYNIKTSQFTELVKEPQTPTLNSKHPHWKKYCADSTFYIFGKAHNLYLGRVENDGSEQIVQLTSDAEAYYSYTVLKSDETDTIPRSFRGDWFQDSRIAYGLRVDSRRVREMMIVNSITPVPTAKKYKFELPGDEYVTQYELVLIYADSGKVVKANIDRFPDQEVKLVRNFNRQTAYDAIYFTRKSRTCDTLQLCSLNPFTAEVKVLVEEHQKPIVNELLHTCAILHGGKELIWWSERDGKGAYYLYDGNGRLKNKIAGGNFVAGEILSIDTLSRQMIFAGYGYYKGRNPYQRYYFKVGFDGKGFTELTPSEGYHELQMSESKHYFIDTYSSVDQYPRQELRSIKGKKVYDIPTKDDTKLLATGWRKPLAIRLKAADRATDLYGVMYLPYDIDTTRRYPIICNVYPGPQTDLLPQTFSYDDNGNASLAQMGFIVVQISYRGSSPYRGPEFYTFGYSNLRDYSLVDCKLCVEQLAARYPFIDLDRVGIYGHSGGGFLSTTAILTYPEFFKVAVAVSGNHDNNIYSKFWGETYNGVKQEVKTDSLGNQTISFKSKIATNIELAKNLKGRLYLITGEIDDNVHPANTMRLVSALIKANKRFDLLVMPNLDHGMYGDYYNNLIRYYFEEHLKSPKPFDSDLIQHSN